MQLLNLPAYEARIVEQNGKNTIFDILRKRYVALTPEEWVRQHFIHFLIAYKKYPASLMANEVQIQLNGTKKRCDTVVYNRELKPRVIIEYKAPDITINQAVFNQISRYNITMKVDYLIISNGMQHYCCKMDYPQNKYAFLPDIPAYNAL